LKFIQINDDDDDADDDIADHQHRKEPIDSSGGQIQIMI